MPPQDLTLTPTKFPGYFITEDGDVYIEYTTSGGNRYSSYKKGEIKKMRTHLRGNGKAQKYQYPAVNISLKDNAGKLVKQVPYSVHKLVAETYISNPNNYTEVDHIDRNKQNNKVSNLRWVTHKENMKNFQKNSEVK